MNFFLDLKMGTIYNVLEMNFPGNKSNWNRNDSIGPQQAGFVHS